MSLQGTYANQPGRGGLQNVEHENLHGDTLDNLEGNFGKFYAHFRSRMTDGHLLSRADVKPYELKPYLIGMVILELVKDDQGSLSDIITRLIGSNVEHFYGNMTGRSITEHPSKDAVARTMNTAAKAVELRAPVLADTRGRLPDGNDLSVRSLYIPLAGDGENIDQIVVYVEIRKSPPQ